MVLSGDHWTFSAEKVPDWIRDAEKGLENAILEYEKSRL